jgi:GNAT superfamily N-acetyltransferase
MFDAWFALYARYAHEIGEHVDERTARTVWQWLLSGSHRVAGIVLLHDAAIVGFAHYRPFPRTLDANEACYLDDLYVAQEHRRKGLAQRMIERIGEIAAAKGWSEVRWVTTQSNEGAQRIYDRIAERSDLVTYRMQRGVPAAANPTRAGKP